MSMAPVLAMPKDEEPFMIKCNTSEGALGAILSQKQEDKWRPVAFLSKALNPTECNYEIYNKELLAIITTFGKWQQYLIGAKEIEVFIDHQNLTYFRKLQKLNRRQARWVTELTQFNFMLKHRPKRLNSKADLLSRCADHEMCHSDNQNVTVLKAAWFWGLEMADINKDLIEKIKLHTKWDEGITEAVRDGTEGWEKINELVTWKDHIYILLNSNLRLEMIKLNHNSQTSGTGLLVAADAYRHPQIH